MNPKCHPGTPSVPCNPPLVAPRTPDDLHGKWSALRGGGDEQEYPEWGGNTIPMFP